MSYRLEFHHDGGGIDRITVDTWESVKKLMLERGNLFIRGYEVKEISDDILRLPIGKYKPWKPNDIL